MQVVFPTSVPTIPEIDVSSVYLSTDRLLNSAGLAMALSDKGRNGDKIVHFGEYNYRVHADTVVSKTMKEATATEHYLKRGVLVFPKSTTDKKWFDGYSRECSDTRISVIVIPTSSSDSLQRVLYLREIVSRGLFCLAKPHWLYGVPNPAELSAYRRLFSNFIMNKIELAICSTCFLYSIFGIPFSYNSGIMQRLEEIDDTRLSDLGMSSWMDYSMNREQMRCFYSNVDIVQLFAEGWIAESYMENIYDALEVGV
jgi:hypothetical protein